MTKRNTIILINLFFFTILGFKKVDKPLKNCFNQDNFNIVYQYLKAENIKSKSDFFKYNNTKIYLTNDSTITTLNHNNYCKILKNKGIISLEILKSENEKMTNQTNLLFCEILSKVKKKRISNQ